MADAKPLMKRAGVGSAVAVAVLGLSSGPASAAEEWREVYGAQGEDVMFTSVAAGDSENVWALGAQYPDDSDTPRTYIQRYDGQEWAQEDLPADWTLKPEVAGASGPDNAWAVGPTVDGVSAIHFDGTDWTPYEMDAGLTPNDLDVLAEDEAWLIAEDAVGDTRAVRFDGEIWRDWTSPPAGANQAIDGADGDTVVAVGSTSDAQPLAALYNGTEWTDLEVPEVELPSEIASATFNDVLVRAGDDITAVGYVHDLNDDDINEYWPLTAHYDGESWDVTVDQDRNASLEAIEDDGSGGMWIQEESWDPTFVHHDSAGTVTRDTPEIENYDLSVRDLALVPGTQAVVSVGSSYDEGDPDVPTGYGVVLASGL
ncbi:hypothetical protein ACFO4E_19785 [Nocardiopsis mangrovi]|uniref:Uncharacterized protein n=1 Tax=Nocardiopsis mangrovi TaxID=1179818 RepID=A0ABV9DYX4_9ACTN